MVTLNTHRESHAPSARRRARARGGFTLIEILTVIVILGIASAVIAPQIGSRDDIKAKAGARVVIADLLYAQNMAIAKQAYYYVRFDAANESYQLLSEPGATQTDGTVITHPINKGPFTTQFGPAGAGRVRDIKIKSAVFNGITSSFTDEFTLAFDELGTPYVYCYDVNDRNEMLDGDIVIECGKHTITVSVERYTGEIKVK